MNSVNIKLLMLQGWHIHAEASILTHFEQQFVVRYFTGILDNFSHILTYMPSLT